MLRPKAFLNRHLPGLYGRLRLWRYRHTLHRILAAIEAHGGLTVQEGPFRGLRYVRRAVSRDRLLSHTIVPKILGCYERELHLALECVLARTYSRVINIGCAEGYYTVGFALRQKAIPVFAFDTDPVARELCREMAKANGVNERVILGAECTLNTLQTLTTERSLVICDCEGCELHLLQPMLVPGLRSCDLLVELHDGVDPTISRTLRDRFSSSHQVELIRSVEPNPPALPSLSGMSAYSRHLAVSEFRSLSTGWALLTSDTG